MSFEKTVPFCFGCGFEVQVNWTFCPNCNIDLTNSGSNHSSIQISDSAIKGDVYIHQGNKNIYTQNTTTCANCGAEGSVIISPCARGECSKKSCQNCISDYSGHCGENCLSLTNQEKANELMRAIDERIQKENRTRERRKVFEGSMKSLYRWKSINEKLLTFFAYVLLIFLCSLFVFAIISPNYSCSDGSEISGFEVYDEEEDCPNGEDEIQNYANDNFVDNYESFDLGFGISVIGMTISLPLALILVILNPVINLKIKRRENLFEINEQRY